MTDAGYGVYAALEAKLAKAVDEMTWALPTRELARLVRDYLAHPNDGWLIESFRNTLTELETKP
jgi:hypothetical protein